MNDKQLFLITKGLVGVLFTMGATLLMGIPASRISDEFGLFYGILTLVVLDLLCLFAFTEWVKSEKRLMSNKIQK